MSVAADLSMNPRPPNESDMGTLEGFPSPPAMGPVEQSSPGSHTTSGPSEPALIWTDVCAVDDIVPNTGAPALIAGRQIAIVRLGTGRIYALSNYDPFSEAFVIARGIVGDRGGCPKIASPIYKQNFDLRTGVCLDDPSVSLPTYPVRVRDGRIEIALSRTESPPSRSPSAPSGPETL